MRLSIRIIPIAILVTFCFGHMKAQAEFQIDENLPIGNGESKYVQCAIDNHNNVVSFPWYIPPSERTAGNTIPTSSCLSGNFVLIFEDVVNGTGQGYDGAQRPLMQNVACEVFSYISRVFVIQGAPEVVFQQATNNPQTLTLASNSFANETNVIIYDVLGNFVGSFSLEPGVTEQTIVLNYLQSGAYYYQLLIGDRIQASERLIILK